MKKEYSTLGRLEQIAKMTAEETVKQCVKALKEMKSEVKKGTVEKPPKPYRGAVFAPTFPPFNTCEEQYKPSRTIPYTNPYTGRIVIAPRRKRGE